VQAVVTQGLTKKYKSYTAVDGLDLTIEQGETFALLGVNGAGKTTVIKMLSCLSRPTGGDALLNGKSVLSQAAEIKKFIGVSPQETAIAPNLTVKENLELLCGIYGFPRQKRRLRIEGLCSGLKLEEALDKRAGKLSGGYQRRLSIALALISEPEILFLDEPTLGLDVLVRSDLWDIIRSLRGRSTIILTTHYLEEAEALSERIGIMKEGRLLALGTAHSLKARTGAASFEQAFINIVKGEIK